MTDYNSTNDGGSPQYDPADNNDTESDVIVPLTLSELETPFRMLWTFDAKIARIERLKECDWSLVPVTDEAAMLRIAFSFKQMLLDVSAHDTGVFPKPDCRSPKREADLAYDALKAYVRCLRYNAEWCRRRNAVRVHVEMSANPDEWELRAELVNRLKQCDSETAHCLAEVLMQGWEANELFDQLRDYKAVDVAALFDRCPRLSIW